MKLIELCGMLLVAGIAATGAATAQENAVKELIPTGKLRFGVAFAPKMSALFVVKEADGSPRGITPADLGNELAQKLGVPVEFMVAPNTGVLTDALADARIDAAFMPVDDERRKRLDFGPAYCAVQSTYMVMPASGIKTLAGVDRPGVRVVGVANTTTIRASGRTLKQTQPVAATSIEDAIGMLRDGKADAFALGRDSLPDFVALFPGSFIVDGGFQQTVIAIAVPKGRSLALAYVSAFLDNAKRSGSVRKAMDRAGINGLEVAP